PTVSIQGVGTIKLVPDRAEIQFQVITSNKDTTIASEQNKKIMTNVNKAINSLKINKENIKTTEYFVNKIEKMENNKTVSYYEIRNGFQVVVEDISQISKIVSELEKSGVNGINGINFYSSKEKENQKQAMVLAYNDALEKAQAISKAAGYKVSPLEINYDYFSPRGMFPYSLNSASMKSSLEIYTPQSLDVNVSVRAIFKMEK
ncbi:MAG: SIMPL domain-containing protein, partial [Fusobacteriaceae bacterium]